MPWSFLFCVKLNSTIKGLPDLISKSGMIQVHSKGGWKDI